MKIFRNITAAALLGTKLVATLPLQFDRRGVLSVYTHFSHPTATQHLTQVVEIPRVTVADPIWEISSNRDSYNKLRGILTLKSVAIKTRVIES